MLDVSELAVSKVKEILRKPENKDQNVRVYFDGIG